MVDYVVDLVYTEMDNEFVKHVYQSPTLMCTMMWSGSGLEKRLED